MLTLKENKKEIAKLMVTDLFNHLPVINRDLLYTLYCYYIVDLTLNDINKYLNIEFTVADLEKGLEDYLNLKLRAKDEIRTHIPLVHSQELSPIKLPSPEN